MNIFDEYLGDGVYASWDGHHIWLDLRAQDTTTRIALEPAVLERLFRYRAKIENTVRTAGEAAVNEALTEKDGE